MAARSQPYRLEFPLNPLQVEQLDEMLQILFDDMRNGNLTITETQFEGVLGVDQGGTGLTSYSVGDILYADGTESLTTLGIGTANYVLQVNAGATAPEWGLVAFDNMVPAAAASTLIGRRSGSTGDWEAITLGSNLSMNSSGVLSATGGSPGGSSGQVQYNNAGSFGGQWINLFGYWSPLTNGDPASPELIFDGDGDVVAVWTAL